MVWVGGMGRLRVTLGGGGGEEGDGEDEMCYGIGREVRQGTQTCDLWMVREKSVEGREVKVAGEPGGGGRRL